MSKLAIRGHETRGKEVIEILEMLGGKNDKHCFGRFINRIYFINENGYIECADIMLHLDYFQLTLEEFLNKFPYKVGDKVQINGDSEIFVVKSMKWYENEVYYDLESVDGYPNSNWIAYQLQPYKEKSKIESMYNEMKEAEKHRTLLPNEVVANRAKIIFREDASPSKTELDLGDKFEVVVEDGKTYVVRKKLKYPKTYEECSDILGTYTDPDIDGYKHELLWVFQKLLICRDAYWKIAGEQMGLDKPWELDYTNPDIDLYVIINIHNNIEKAKYGYGFQHCVLTFPTEEMRNAFYENFKDLIEECKELL